MEQDRVARRWLDPLEGVEADDVIVASVDQPAARDDLRHRLDAEPPDTGIARELGHAVAAVAAVADLKVAERVEMRAELLGAGHDLGDPVDAV